MFDLANILHQTPQQVEYNSPTISDNDMPLLRFCEKLLEEGQAWRDDLGLDKIIERGINVLASKHFVPREEKKHRTRVVANFFRYIIKNIAGQLTDTIPQITVHSRAGHERAADMIKKAAYGVWTERSVQQLLSRSIVMSSMAGSSAWEVAWDRSLDMGYGDVRINVMQPNQCIVDPFLHHAESLQDDAEYVIVQVVRPLTQFVELYPKRGYMVRAEPALSNYKKKGDRGARPYTYPGAIWRKPSRSNSQFDHSAIPRATEYRLFFRDRTINPKAPKTAEGTPNYLFPRKRLTVWAGDTILYDGQSAYWDGGFPVEIMDWGIETTHPYGESEVENLYGMQMAVNILFSGIVHNSRLINDPPWQVEEDALDPDDLVDLKRYGDREGHPFVVRPGLDIKRIPPGQFTGIVFQTLGALREAMETVAGIKDVSTGKAPSGITSGIALESLLLSAQTPIRLQSRAVEAFLKRIGQLLVSRIIQYFTDSRFFQMTDQPWVASNFTWQRQEFIKSLKMEKEEEIEKILHNLFRDVRFTIAPESGLAVARLQKLAVMERLNAQGKIPDIEVLKAAEIPDAEEKLQLAKEEMIEKAQIQMALQQGMQPQRPGGVGILSARNTKTPPAYQGGVAGR